MIPTDFIGTIPQWLTALSALAGLTWAFLRFGLGWRGQTMADEANIRDHYAKEVAAMRLELNQQESNFRDVETHLRALLAASDRRHEECEAARAQSRREVEALHIELTGLKREMAQNSQSTAQLIGDLKGSGNGK